MKTFAMALIATTIMAGCASEPRPKGTTVVIPPSNKTTTVVVPDTPNRDTAVVVPQNSGANVVCQDGTRPPC